MNNERSQISRLWDSVTLLGVLCFLVGAAAWVFGDLSMPWLALLPAIALVLVGVGQTGKRASRQS